VKVALDTNRYVDLCKGVAGTVALLEEAEEIALPFVVLGELRAGFAHGRRQAENEQILRRFLLKDGVNVLFADDQTTHHYAFFGNFASKALLFPRMTCGLRQWSCSTIWPSMHVTNISITCRNLSASEPPL